MLVLLVFWLGSWGERCPAAGEVGGWLGTWASDGAPVLACWEPGCCWKASRQESLQRRCWGLSRIIAAVVGQSEEPDWRLSGVRRLLFLCTVGNQIHLMAMSGNRSHALLINKWGFVWIYYSDGKWMWIEYWFCFSLVTNLLSFDSMLPFKFPVKVCTLPVYFLFKPPTDFVLIMAL